MNADEQMLVLLAQQGDREALNALLEQAQKRLFPYICGMFPNDRPTAEDVLQETLLRIARKLSWLTEPRFFATWSYRIASRETYRVMSRRKSSSAEEIPEHLASPESSPAAFTWSELRDHVSALSPGSRSVVLLHYGDDKPLHEIALILDLPLGTVKSRLSYGLVRLREMLHAETN